MGQASSRGSPDPTPPAAARRRGRLSQLLVRPDAAAASALDDSVGVAVAAPPPNIPTSRISRRNSLLPFPRLLSTGSESRLSTHNTDGIRRRLTLSRARSTITGSISGLISRQGQSRTRGQMDDSGEFVHPGTSRPATRSTYNDDSGLFLPNLDMSDDLTFNFDDWHMEDEEMRRDPLLVADHRRRSSFRSSANISERLNPFRPDRGLRNMTSTLRRGRRSPIRRAEDHQTAILHRLLSVAAATTAASLVGGDHRAVTDARSIGGQGENGTFESFIQALHSGRIASTLRQNGGEAMDDGGDAVGPIAPLNFFRMFRFGSPNATTGDRANGRNNSAWNSTTDGTPGEGTDGRMIPVIIVGIRSINTGIGTGPDEPNIPPFLDAISSYPTHSLTSPSETTIDTMLPPPRNGTRFSHRRRASMGGLSNFPSSYDNQRHHRSPDRPRPLSTTSDSITAPRPPPSTPASAGLSAVSTTNNSPSMTRTPSSPTTMSRVPSRRGSFRASGLESTSEEEQPPVHQRAARQRRMSESDFTRFGSGSSRRNGVVAPDAPDEPPTEGHRSWIIYVLGGSYPEDHPLVTTPSLFSDSPTYEDMLLLSALLGPAKPPVASESDVEAAGGLFRIMQTDIGLHAIAIEGDEKIVLAADERCLVCLCDYEAKEEARKLVKCGHLYHKECIDQWLTTGRNSCPLCREQGVDETSSGTSSPVPSGSASYPDTTAPEAPAAPYVA